MSAGALYSVSGSKVMSLKLVVQVGPAKSVNPVWWVEVGVGGTLLHTVFKAFMPVAVPLSVWKAPCVICQDMAFQMSPWKVQVEGGWCSGTRFGPALTSCFLCTCLHISGPHVHTDTAQRGISCIIV